MICLALNTATTVLSVAIADSGKALFSFEAAETRDQGNILINHIQRGLKETGLGYADIGLIAVVTGPGSFTGIRIGIAAARAIGMAAKIPLCGVSSFDLFAEKRDGRKNIVAVESFRDELYFRTEGTEPVNLTPEQFANSLQGGAFFVSGDARDKLRAVLPDAAYADRTQDARDLAALAIKRGPDAEKPVPFYLRPPDVTIKSS